MVFVFIDVYGIIYRKNCFVLIKSYFVLYLIVKERLTIFSCLESSTYILINIFFAESIRMPIKIIRVSLRWNSSTMVL